MSINNKTRIAWLLPVAFFYWQPVLAELARLYPDTKVFTGRWLGYANGYEDSLEIIAVGERKVFRKKREGYGSGFTYLSLKIVAKLFEYMPNLIFSSSFGIWTILAILLKPIGGWKIVIAYEGSAPGVDFLNSPLRILIRRLMVFWSDAYITNSKAGQIYLTGILRASKEKTFVIPYEMPSKESLTPAIDVDLRLKSAERPLFLFVGKIIPRKGLKTLLAACSILQSQECHNFTLIVVGDGEQKSELETYTKDKGLDSVRWIGNVHYQEVSSYFQTADIFVLPTIEDTWGVVILEAMLLGKVILCSKGAGASELIQEGKNGYTFEPRKPEILAEIMKSFIDDPGRIAPMQEESKRIMTNLTPSISAQSLANVIQSLSVS